MKSPFHLPIQISQLPRSYKICLLALLLLVLLGVPLLRYGIFLRFPAGSGKNQKILSVKEGSTLRKIAEELERLRLVSSDGLFVLHAKLEGAEGAIKAGPYLFNDGMTPGVILKKLLQGDTYISRFPVPEGYSIYQIAELLERRGLVEREEFLRKCKDKLLLAELGISAASAEGYLYPCTYEIDPETTAEELLREMVSQFHRHYARRFQARVKSSGMNTVEVLTLASMVEKEAVSPSERPLVASVFLNRLRKRMPLQSDPTAVYQVRAFAGKVSKRDIMQDTPYNTYKIKGLPPGPIGNPSPDAIEAVIRPARTNYLYFVSRMDGTHHFSATLEEHNRAVEKYLKPRQEATQGLPQPRT